MSQLQWVSRVPVTLTAAKQLLLEIDSSAFVTSSLSGYKIAACGNSYAGIQQRWLVMDVEIQRAGRFILATNVLDEQVLGDEDVLAEYKAQQATERGFRFLKDPLFFTSSIFLNTPLTLLRRWQW